MRLEARGFKTLLLPTTRKSAEERGVAVLRGTLGEGGTAKRDDPSHLISIKLCGK